MDDGRDGDQGGAIVGRQGFDYERMMDRALRGVMREALGHAAERGLPGQHHFYVTFRTDHAGVQIPASLRQRFPREMTIVLQFQFWGLEVDTGSFSVTLSFDGKHERLTIPLAAVTAFVDPSVQFGLQFESRAETAAETKATEAPAAASAAPAPISAPDPAAPASEGDRIVKLDTFRRK